MALFIIPGTAESEYTELMDQVYVLRHRSFVEELGWETLRRDDGRERDQFDHEEAIHFLIVEGGKVAVYSRLLPTTRPHLLSDVYPHLASRDIPRGEDIMEWTRFTVAHQFRGDGRWSFAGGTMIRSVIQYCLRAKVRMLTLQGHPIWITRFLSLGFSPQPLGLPTVIEGGTAVAIQFEISEELLNALQMPRENVAARAGSRLSASSAE